MRTTKVLLIESARNNGISFAASLKRKYQVQVAHSGKQGLLMALARPPDVIVLDAASLRTSGHRICARLRAGLKDTPIIHILPEDVPPAESAADVLLSPPFTVRKLINRIERFAVVPETQSLDAGPFTLNLEQQTLVTPWSEKKLTPKLATLIEMFMQNPNIVLERKHIMKKVWNTDYMGDTRTLDVHIRWLRKVLEPNPRSPQYLTTVRGVGYRLVIPDSSEAKTEQLELPVSSNGAETSSKPSRKSKTSQAQ